MAATKTPTRSSAYRLADELAKHDDVDEIQARSDEIRVVHVPDDMFDEELPPALAKHIQDIIRHTSFSWRGDERDDVESEYGLVEIHTEHDPRVDDKVTDSMTELQVVLCEEVA